MNRRLRFCMITTFDPPYNYGGDGLFVERLSRELAERGHSVDVVHCADSYRVLRGKRSAAERPSHPGVTVHTLSSRAGFLSPLATQQTGHPLLKTRKIQRVLDRGHDVIHYHNLSLVGGPGILKLGRGLKLCTTHEYWLICPTHVMFRFNRKACERPRCLPCILSHKRPPQLWRHTSLLRSACRHVDTFISPCQSGIDLHRRMGFEAPMVHIPHFVPRVPAILDAGSTRVDVSGRPYLLFVGRLERIKGLQTIIPIFREHPRARLLVAGSGSYEAELRKLSAGSANIEFLGHVPGPELRALYRGAVATIAPSICYEIGPLVVPEGFREGTPALVRNLGGMPEWIETGGGGAVFDTEHELATWIDRLLDEPGLRDELGRKGLSACEREWSIDAHLERYFGLIAKRLSRGRRSPPATVTQEHR